MWSNHEIILVMFAYERLEEFIGIHGLDVLLHKSDTKRDSILQKLPADELSCLFQFLNDKEIRRLFSKDTILSAFEQLPIIDTFTVFYETKKNLLTFFSRQDIIDRIDVMALSLFCSEMEHHADLLIELVDRGFIPPSMVRRKMHRMSLSQVSRLLRSEHHKRFYDWCMPHPLLSGLPLPMDVALLLITYI